MTRPDPPDDSSGEPEPEEESPLITERTIERFSEDERYIPVIVKRNDESKRHPDDILEKAIDEGLEQLERPALSLTLSALAAGLIIGFSAMAVAVVTTAAHEFDASPLVVRLATAIVYPLGFVVCIMSGSELFTEHTATAVYPVLDRQAPLRRLPRLWTLVLFGNLLGAFGSGVLLSLADGVVDAESGYLTIAEHLIGYSSPTLFVSALLAGWLMALGAWLTLATPPTVSQIVTIYIVTFLIGLGGLHHSIAGSAEMFTALILSPELSRLEGARFIAVAILGNLVGGSLFVAALNYGHIRRSQAVGK